MSLAWGLFQFLCWWAWIAYGVALMFGAYCRWRDRRP